MAQINVTRDDTYVILGELYVEKEAIRKYSEKLEAVVLEQQGRIKELENEAAAAEQPSGDEGIKDTIEGGEGSGS